MDNMKWDSKKWKAYVETVETVGIDVLISLIENNPIFKNWGINGLAVCNDFNPINYRSHYGIFTALGLDIKDFLVDDTITGVEALRALADGHKLMLDTGTYWIKKDKLWFERNAPNRPLSIAELNFNDFMTLKFTIKP